MKNLLARLFLVVGIIAGLGSGTLHGVIFQAQCLVKDGKVRYLLYDWHRDFIGAEKTKRELAALQTYGRDCFFIVEDTDDYRGANPDIQAATRIMHGARDARYRETPARRLMPHPFSGVGGFVEYAQRHGMHVENAEFRHEDRYYEYMVFENNDWQNGRFKGATPAALLQHLSGTEQEVATAVKKIRAFNDGPLFNKFYAQAITAMDQFFTWLHTTRAAIQSGEGMTVDLFREIARHSFRGTNGLLDSFILHALYQHANDACVIVYAGGVHCNVVSALLVQDGYTLLHESGRFYTPGETDEAMVNRSIDMEQFFKEASAKMRARVPGARADIAPAVRAEPTPALPAPLVAPLIMPAAAVVAAQPAVARAVAAQRVQARRGNARRAPARAARRPAQRKKQVRKQPQKAAARKGVRGVQRRQQQRGRRQAPRKVNRRNY